MKTADYPGRWKTTRIALACTLCPPKPSPKAFTTVNDPLAFREHLLAAHNVLGYALRPRTSVNFPDGHVGIARVTVFVTPKGKPCVVQSQYMKMVQSKPKGQRSRKRRAE